MHYKKIFIISVIILGVISHITYIGTNNQDGKTPSANISSQENNFENIRKLIINKGQKIYTEMRLWYKLNNTLTTIIPDILRVPFLDFIAVLLGVFLFFFGIVRFLSE